MSVEPRAPLVPVALAVGLGVALDRSGMIPASMLLTMTLGLSAAWLLALLRSTSRLSLVLLWLVAGLLAASWHHVYQAWPADAIGHYASLDRLVVKLRGVVAEDVAYHPVRRPELLSGQGTLGYSVFLLDVHAIQLVDRWQTVSGRVRVSVEGELRDYRIGNGLEITGSLVALTPPVNPGGMDFRQTWYDQGLQASVGVKTTHGIVAHPESDRWCIAGLMAQTRAWVRQTLLNLMPARQAGIAQALLCGEQSALAPDQFEDYLQAGVYHVLAVSGQHLVILCLFVGLVLRFTGLELRRRSIGLALFVIGFTLLTGARPPVVRAAIIVLAWCLGLWLRRRVHPLNSLALAWIGVAIFDPGDLANTGCQLSFLAVLILSEVIAPWYHWEYQHRSPLDRLEEELRPASLQLLYWLAFHFKWAALASLVVWLAAAPLVIHRFHLVSPVAVLLGPLVALPIMLAMMAGMTLLLFSWVPVFNTLLAAITASALVASDALVSAMKLLPFSYGYWPDVPGWWVLIFYAGLLGVLLLLNWQKTWKRWATLATVWLLLVLFISPPDVPAGLRMTVLSVGHGTAVVLELPDGQTLLYDAGSLAGPDVAFRHVSHYLWYRRRRTIEDVLLSHADLDHFNALPDLVERFRVGIVLMTPTFGQKADQGTRSTLAQLRAKQVRTGTLRKRDIIEAGDVVIEVLHPPERGPDGSENARSLVLLIMYQGHRILLTGDLEQPGLGQVLEIPIAPVDVLVAPHHGSNVSNTQRFAAWCRPRLVVSSETFPRGVKFDPYTPIGATLWRTWIHGGVTVELDAAGIRARSTLTGQQWIK